MKIMWKQGSIYFFIFISNKVVYFNPSRPNPMRREKNYIFIFTLLCGASKGFTKALRNFIKPFEEPQTNVKIKI